GRLWYSPFDGSNWREWKLSQPIESFEVSPNGRWVLARTKQGFMHILDTTTKVTTEIATFQDNSWASLRSTGELAYSAGLAQRIAIVLPNGRKRGIEPEPN